MPEQSSASRAVSLQARRRRAVLRSRPLGRNTFSSCSPPLRAEHIRDGDPRSGETVRFRGTREAGDGPHEAHPGDPRSLRGSGAHRPLGRNVKGEGTGDSRGTVRSLLALAATSQARLFAPGARCLRTLSFALFANDATERLAPRSI